MQRKVLGLGELVAREGTLAIEFRGGLGRLAPAGPDRVDQDKVGKCKPGVRVVLEPQGRRVAVPGAEFGDAWTDQAEMEIGRCGAWATVEHERDGALVGLAAVAHVGGV